MVVRNITSSIKEYAVLSHFRGKEPLIFLASTESSSLLVRIQK